MRKLTTIVLFTVAMAVPALAGRRSKATPF
jgi:hypothetical protein